MLPTFWVTPRHPLDPILQPRRGFPKKAWAECQRIFGGSYRSRCSQRGGAQTCSWTHWCQAICKLMLIGCSCMCLDDLWCTEQFWKILSSTSTTPSCVSSAAEKQPEEQIFKDLQSNVQVTIPRPKVSQRLDPWRSAWSTWFLVLPTLRFGPPTTMSSRQELIVPCPGMFVWTNMLFISLS